MVIGIIIAVVVVLVLLIWIISIKNNIKRLEIKVQESLSGIEVALTKRFDLITKLLDATKGYMKHEEDVLTGVIKMRQGMSIGELNEAEAKMSAMSTKLFAVAEAYPDLKASAVFADLQRGIWDAEEHLQAARRLYNANVTKYNTYIVVFPNSMFAKGCTAKEFFVAEEHKREDVKISF